MSERSEKTYLNFRAEKKTNINFKKKDWCRYKGECKEDLNLHCLCWHCIHMGKFDVPHLIEENLENVKH